MSMPNNNPFVLPGMGQQSDLSGNPLMASMEMMRQAWAGLTGPGGLAQSLPMTPPMNLEDLERRISELRSVEGWLRMNLSMLSSTIQGMEVQRSTIATLRSFADSLSSTDRTSGDTPASPLEVVLGLRPAPKTQGKPAAAHAPQPSSSAAPAGSHPGAGNPQGSGTAPGFGGFGQPGAASGADTPSGDTGNHSDQAWSQAAGEAAAQASQAAAQAGQGARQAASDATAQTSNAAQAWWDMLQQQFSNIAAATAASMPQTAGGAPTGAPGRASTAKSAGKHPGGTRSGGSKSAPASSTAAGATASTPPRGAAKPAASKAGAKPVAARKSAAKSASAKRAPAARKTPARKSASNKTS